MSLNHPAVNALLNADMPEDKKSFVKDIWYYLKFTNKITDEQEWPFHDIVTYHTYLTPNTHPDAGTMPITLALFLYEDLRSMNNNDARLDHAASSMMEDDIKLYSLFWIEILHKFIIKFTGCKDARRRNVYAKKKVVLNHIFENGEDASVKLHH